MFSCIDCQLVLGYREFQSHVAYRHNYGEFSFREMVCPHSDCYTEIATWSGFLCHIKKHKNVESDIELDLAVASCQSNLLTKDEQQDLFDDEENISVELGVNYLVEQLSEFCFCLLSTGITDSAIDLIVKKLLYTFSQTFELILRVSKPFCEKDFETFSLKTRSLLQAFQKVKSAYQRQKLFEKNDSLLLPVKISLGSRVEVKINNLKRKQVIVEDTFMYVSLLKTLEKILSVSNFKKYFQSDQLLNSKNYSCYSSSQSFKENLLFSKKPNSLQIQIFYDEFETVNPLVSKR